MWNIVSSIVCSFLHGLCGGFHTVLGLERQAAVERMFLVAVLILGKATWTDRSA